ncbi:hypothetical protein AVDCRST_MAG84-832 [uncultured Microcoleus sp.]|uniref:Uncharacterized protein n=1 Tax=uncultured Microcoleus sp. TaxID=259945 RepID=A0A6J4KQP7_9CYAN|nr:hypothetical protein AVDCRST_MAG84-832 [uncultured Microcoleus sp.]
MLSPKTYFCTINKFISPKRLMCQRSLAIYINNNYPEVPV